MGGGRAGAELSSSKGACMHMRTCRSGAAELLKHWGGSDSSDPTCPLNPCPLLLLAAAPPTLRTVPETDNATQTDAFLDRPPTPVLVPPKYGADAFTQVGLVFRVAALGRGWCGWRHGAALSWAVRVQRHSQHCHRRTRCTWALSELETRDWHCAPAFTNT